MVEACKVSWIKVENKFNEARKEKKGYCRDVKGIVFDCVNGDKSRIKLTMKYKQMRGWWTENVSQFWLIPSKHPAVSK